MSRSTLEQRVAVLERQMAQVLGHAGNGSHPKPWLRSLGMFAGDDLMKEVFEEALRYRQEDRQRTKRRRNKK